MDWVSFNSQNFGDALGGAPMSPVAGQSGVAHGSTLSLTASATYMKSASLVFDTYYGYTRAKADSRQDDLNEDIGLNVWAFPAQMVRTGFRAGGPKSRSPTFPRSARRTTFSRIC